MFQDVQVSKYRAEIIEKFLCSSCGPFWWTTWTLKVSVSSLRKNVPFAPQIDRIILSWCYFSALAVVEQDGRFLLHQKEGKGLLSGLWQFPTVVVKENDGTHASWKGSANKNDDGRFYPENQNQRSASFKRTPIHPYSCHSETLLLHPCENTSAPNFKKDSLDQTI